MEVGGGNPIWKSMMHKALTTKDTKVHEGTPGIETFVLLRVLYD
jgi:hypothetical protein